MKICKRVLPLVMAAILCLTSGIAAMGEPLSSAEETQDSRYFYWQLNEDEKRIYDAMAYMYQEGIFQRDGSYELTEEGYVSEALLQAYVTGDYTVMDYFGKAKDAFQYDYPDCFYVDFSYLSLRITQNMETGELRAYLGVGRSDTYLLPGFTPENIETAVEEYNEVVDAIVAQAKMVDSDREAQIYYVNDYIVENMVYRFEYEASAGNARTAYDGLIYGEGVCEAYTRSFQAIMNRLGIPCIDVYGGYRVSDTQVEEHIWNYVQLEDGRWYGVDVTHDDSKGDIRKFCVVGNNELNIHHLPSGRLSGANYEDFEYPELAMEAPREKEIYSDGDLVVKLVEDYYSEEEGEVLKSGTIYVSYRGKNYTQNKEDGYYILSKFSQYYPGTDTWTEMDWAYIEPQYYDVDGMEPDVWDAEMGGYYVRFPLPHIMRAQFAVTTTPPTFRVTEDGGYTGSLYYEGNPNLLTVVSEKIENQWGNYVAPPYPLKADPYYNGQLRCGQKYHVTVTYNDLLVPDGSGIDPFISFTSSTVDSDNATADIYTKIENFYFDGESTIEFDFTPSGQFADHWTLYTFDLNGLLGEKSGKRPVAFSYGCGFATSFCSLGVCGYNWSLMGRPQLLDTSFNTDDWKAVDIETGLPIDIDLDAITNRLVLKTLEPTPKEASDMENVLSKNIGDSYRSASLYNISFSSCKACIVETGQGVRVCVGYPAGYSYEDFAEGEVAFKAYHYKVDPVTNKLTGEVEEISCTAVPQGLIIICKSFSPFAIVAAEVDEETVISKNIVVIANANGKIYEGETLLEGANAILTVEEGQTRELTIKPDEGYDIESVVVDGERQVVDNVDEMTISLSYDEMPTSCTVNASFVTSTVREAAADIEMPADTTSVYVGDELYIAPQIVTYSGTHTYQWYKDGVPLEGETGPQFFKENVSSADAGVYRLEVTSITESGYTFTAAAEITVSVNIAADEEPSEDNSGDNSSNNEPNNESSGNVSSDSQNIDNENSGEINNAESKVDTGDHTDITIYVVMLCIAVTLLIWASWRLYRCTRRY